MFTLVRQVSLPRLLRCRRIRSIGLLLTPDSDPSQPSEEEPLPEYAPNQFYPVRIGDTLDSRYKVVGKLGYGACSTAWLCRNISESGFVTVKICARDRGQLGAVNREYQFYEHISSLDSKHRGQAFIRELYETFEIEGPGGQHQCLVHPPMHMTIRDLQLMNNSRGLDVPLLKWILSCLLEALSFLHDETKVVHGGKPPSKPKQEVSLVTRPDINPSNIMLAVDDESVLDDFEKAKADEPAPAKVVDDSRTIYSSRKLGFPKDRLWGRPVLCDFVESRIGDFHRGLIQPELYRSPEVLFEMGWSSNVNIWNVAVLVGNPNKQANLNGTARFEFRHVFNAEYEDQNPSATHHIAEMVAYLGYPSVEYMRRSEVTKKVFDDEGRWKGIGGTSVPEISLEASTTALDGEAKDQFLSFVKSMLKWVPEERKRSSDLLKDPWLEGASPWN